MKLDHHDDANPNPPTVHGTGEDRAVFLLGWCWGRLEQTAIPIEERVQHVTKAIEAFYRKERTRRAGGRLN